jgi:hypothetical protein
MVLKRLLEVVLKPQIRFKGKAPREFKAERTREYVSGAYTRVREHFNSRDNAAIGP